MNFYTFLSRHYDEMIDWDKRLCNEWQFFRPYFEKYSVKSILDIGCGTGEHAIYFSGKGYKVVGIDPDAGMIDIARRKLTKCVNEPQFLIAGFEQIHELTGNIFDCVLCVGNTLPYVGNETKLLMALKNIRNLIRSDGILITQSRNFDLMKKGENRFLPISSFKNNNDEIILMRFYDVFKERAVLNLVEIRNVDGSWEYTLHFSTQFPVFKKEIIDSLTSTGYEKIELFGDFKMSGFNIKKSTDLIIVTECQ